MLTDEEKIYTVPPPLSEPSPYPRCQHCNADPAPIAPAFITMAGATACVFHCGECRAIFSVQLVGMQGPPQREQSPIIKPF